MRMNNPPPPEPKGPVPPHAVAMLKLSAEQKLRLLKSMDLNLLEEWQVPLPPGGPKTNGEWADGKETTIAALHKARVVQASWFTTEEIEASKKWLTDNGWGTPLTHPLVVTDGQSHIDVELVPKASRVGFYTCECGCNTMSLVNFTSDGQPMTVTTFDGAGWMQIMQAIMKGVQGIAPKAHPAPSEPPAVETNPDPDQTIQ